MKSEIKKGEIIRFGDYDWRVLVSEENKLLIITEDIIAQKAYYNEYTEIDWENCDLRKYLQGEFMQKFNKEEQARIALIENENKPNEWYSTRSGNITKDKIFLLSLEEIDKYFGNSGDYLAKKNRHDWDNDKKEWIKDDNDGWTVSNAHDKDREIRNNYSWWWLRSPGLRNDHAASVCGNGAIDVGGGDANNVGGVRPALWLNLN